MLYREKRTSVGRIWGRVLAVVAGTLQGLARIEADRDYLEGMRGGELQDLQLRRTHDGEYRVVE